VSEPLISSNNQGFIPLPRKDLDFVCQVFEMNAGLCTGMPLPTTQNPDGSKTFGSPTQTEGAAISDRSITLDESNSKDLNSTKSVLEESIKQGDVLQASVCFKVLVFDRLFKSYMWNSNNRGLLSKMVNTETEKTKEAERLAKEKAETE
jgi:hypothetical protein